MATDVVTNPARAEVLRRIRAAKGGVASADVAAFKKLTLDQVRLLESDNVVSETAKRDGRTLEGLGIAEPVAVEAVVPDYLEQYRPKGQFSSYQP